MKKLVGIATFAAALMLMWSLPAAATGDVSSDWLTVWSPTGAVVGSVAVSESGVVTGKNSACLNANTGGACGPGEDPNDFYYINDPSLVGSGPPTALCDGPPCSSTSGNWSDIFGLGGSPAHLGFFSDADPGFTPFGAQGGIFQVENGPVSATYLLPTSLQSAGYTAAFNSTPEPATLTLLGSGLLGLAGVIRRRIMSL